MKLTARGDYFPSLAPRQEQVWRWRYLRALLRRQLRSTIGTSRRTASIFVWDISEFRPISVADDRVKVAHAEFGPQDPHDDMQALAY